MKSCRPERPPDSTDLGTTVSPNMDVFLENFRRGEGVISGPKNYIANFVGFKAVYFGRKFWKNVQKGGRGGVIANPKNPIANLRILKNFLEKKRNVISKKGREGGQGRLQIFQINIHI